MSKMFDCNHLNRLASTIPLLLVKTILAFLQSDICFGVINWIRHNSELSERFPLLSEHLNQFFCLHQISSSATAAITALHAEANGDGEPEANSF
jgi:hypothetical protein